MSSDQLAVFYGKEFRINSRIAIKQPTIGEIIDYGEAEFFALISRVTAISSEYKALLWDNGIDYENIDDFVMFAWMMCSQPVSATSILFGELDFTKLSPQEREDGSTVLYDPDQDITIDFNLHRHIVEYFRDAYGIVKKPERAANQKTKMKLIELDRMDHQRATSESHKSMLQPLISSLVNSAGCKYDYNTIRGITFGQLIDSVQRLQVIQSAQALMQGAYSGFADTSKVPKSQWDWTRPLTK